MHTVALDQAADIIRRAHRVVALTGAGLSVESGIPPFRGPGGLWTKYGEPPMNGFERFLADPAQAWRDRLAPSGPMRELWETVRRAQPNPAHVALAELEASGTVHALITQNIDDLHRRAGSRRLLEIHGNATLVRCLGCVARFPSESIATDVLPPRCPSCDGILKSDTVSFGEPIPADVLEGCYQATEGCDCMIVAGTSATVYPAAQFAVDVASNGGQLIEINPYESELSPVCAVSLRGAAGEMLPLLQQRLLSDI